jgi:hypothetical protein
MSAKKLSLTLLFVVFVVVLLATAVFASNPVLPPVEAFESKAAPKCPTSVTRRPDGKIQIEPGSVVLNNIQEYVDYMKSVYAHDENATCIAPMIPRVRESQEGVLGGIGNGAISPSGVEKESATRVVLDTRQDGYSPSEKRPLDKLDDCDEETFRDAQSIIELLRENLGLWKDEEDAE